MSNQFKDTFKTYYEKFLELSNKPKFLIIVAASCIFLGFLLVLLFSLNTRVTILPPPKQATIVYDAYGKEYTRIYEENRIEIPLNKIPESMKRAILNVEDARFYEHSGFDVRAIFRALLKDIRHGEYVEGASTITQQLARNVMLTQKKSIIRKLQELVLAIKIERSYTKDEILERYLNQIYLGHGAYGVEAASRMYFGKSVYDLDIHEVALIVGLIKSPNNYSPFTKQEAALKRRAVVLGQMLKYGSLTQEQFEYYNKKPLKLIAQNTSKRKAAYFVDYLIQTLSSKVNGVDEQTIYTGGYKIYTTIDATAQRAADDAITLITGGDPDAAGVIQPQLALVAIDPRTGYIKAMIGGRDFGNTQLNRAVYANRQPGSTFKPFVYTTAIDSKRYTASTIMTDEEISFPRGDGQDWTPRNFSRRYEGNVSLRYALEQSINVISVKLVEDLGPGTVLNYAQRMGLKSLVTSGRVNDLNLASMALGGLTRGVTPLEMAAAYSPLANQGISVEPLAILKLIDDDGNVLYEDHIKKKAAIPDTTAYMMTDLLRGVILRGTGRSANIDRPAAGKTGTTNDNTNAWFVGYTPDLLAAVWIGNDAQNKQIKIDGVSVGSGMAARIWGRFMRQALVNTPPSDFPIPDGITTAEVCAQTGMFATSKCTDIEYETFIAGTEPISGCSLHGGGYYNNSIQSSFGRFNENNNSDNLNNNQGFVPANNNNDPTKANNNSNIDLQPKNKKRKIIVKICSESGALAGSHCPESSIVAEIFTEGEEPHNTCTVHK